MLEVVELVPEAVAPVFVAVPPVLMLLLVARVELVLYVESLLGPPQYSS